MKNLFLSALLAAVSAAAPSASAGSPYRWLFCSRSCTNEKQLQSYREFVDRAAAVGMNGITLGNVDYLWQEGEGAKDCVRRLRDYGKAKGVEIIPHGWSIGYGTMLGVHPDMAESLAVNDMPFVARGREAVSVKGRTPIVNPDLAQYDLGRNRFAGWTHDEPGLLSFVDVAGGHDGKPAVRFDPGPKMNRDRHSRFFQRMNLKPNRRYRVTNWARGVGQHMHFHPVRIQVYVETEPGKSILAGGFGLPLPEGDVGWHRMSVEFMTGPTGVTSLYLGSWSATGGHFWLSDVTLEEIGITEISLRKTATRRLRNAKTGAVYAEGRDWTLAQAKRGEEVRFDLPEGSAIKAGDELLFDCYVVSHGGPKNIVSPCMSDPRLYECLAKSARCIEDLLHPPVWFLSLDEVMNGGTCELCRARKTDMAHIFGECTTKMRDIIRSVSPKAEIYAWSDMFDPNHNAHDGIGACRGTFAGSGDLIPADVGMMLWYGERIDRSAPYFAERGHAFVGSVCCDGKGYEKHIRMWRDRLSRYPGCRGFMYTTWLNDYTKIGDFTNILKTEK